MNTIYVYTRPLSVEVIKALKAKADNLRLGKKKRVYVYDADTRSLVNNGPFYSILEAANWFSVESRAITRHLDTKIPIKRNGRLVYFFKEKLDPSLSKELLASTGVGDSRNHNAKV